MRRCARPRTARTPASHAHVTKQRHWAAARARPSTITCSARPHDPLHHARACACASEGATLQQLARPAPRKRRVDPERTRVHARFSPADAAGPTNVGAQRAQSVPRCAPNQTTVPSGDGDHRHFWRTQGHGPAHGTRSPCFLPDGCKRHLAAQPRRWSHVQHGTMLRAASAEVLSSRSPVERRYSESKPLGTAAFRRRRRGPPMHPASRRPHMTCAPRAPQHVQ